MTKRSHRAPALTGAALLLAISAPAMAAGDVTTGPSSSESPYIVPVADGVKVRSIVTVGDAVRGYRLVGIPDGLGALGDDDDELSLFVNHELGAGVGVARAHGGIGAFVSEWSIDGDDLRVRKGRDLITTVNLWNGAAYEVATDATFARFCSADLPERSAFWDPRSGTGYNGRILLNGEEAGAEGRAFAHVVSGRDKGTTWELPALGNLGYENALANPATGRRTVVVSTDDTTPGQVYLYVGEKQRRGTPVERAGLTDGTLYGIRVPGVAAESRTTALGGETSFTLASLGDVTGSTGAQLQAESVTNGVTEFLRPEDGHWDPRDPDVFYFVTTDRFDSIQDGSGAQEGNSRLWRLRFDDINDPTAGGTISMLLDGTEGPQMMDNITVDRTGHILIQEDPGNQAYLARIWSYDIADDELTVIAKADPARFSGSTPLTADEETSGIIDASRLLGKGWFLATVQAHYPIAGELVEGGQLVALFNPASARGHRD